MNKAIIYGNLTKDVEVRNLSNGTFVLSFTVAVQRNFKNANGEYDADFINCKYFRKQSGVEQYLLKGQSVIVEGRIQTGSYDAQDGTKRYTTDIIVNELKLVGGKKQEGQVKPSDFENNSIRPSDFNELEDPFAQMGLEVAIDDNFLE